MKVREVLDRLLCEEPKTSYAAGIKAYADQMLRNYSGGLDADLPTTYADMEKVLLEGSEDWESRSLNFQWMPDETAIAKRLGIDNVVDVANIDMTKIQGSALKSAFLLIWAEVLVGNRMEETFMIRRRGWQSIPRDFLLVG